MARKSRRTRHVGGPLYRTNYSLPRRHLRLRRYFSLTGGVVAILFLGYVFLFSSLFKVRKIIVSGNTTTPSSQISTKTYEVLDSTFAGRNIVFLNPKVVERGLAEANFQFDTIKVKRTLGRDIRVVVTERRPSILWQSNTSIYILSDDGRAIEQVGENKPNTLPIIRDQANLPVELGKTIVPAQFIIFVRDLLAELPASGVEVKDLSVPATTNELYIQTKIGYVIKFDTNRQVSEQLSDLTAVLSTLKKQNKTPREYIDLRIPQKVFYQ